MKKLFLIMILGSITACSLFENEKSELQEIIDDVLADKANRGISIDVTSIPASK